ncbi:MAG: hypothetical protein H7836_01575 [Magnetococcus sp. YQC-3]
MLSKEEKNRMMIEGVVYGYTLTDESITKEFLTHYLKKDKKLKNKLFDNIQSHISKLLLLSNDKLEDNFKSIDFDWMHVNFNHPFMMNEIDIYYGENEKKRERIVLLDDVEEDILEAYGLYGDDTHANISHGDDTPANISQGDGRFTRYLYDKFKKALNIFCKCSSSDFEIELFKDVFFQVCASILSNLYLDNKGDRKTPFKMIVEVIYLSKLMSADSKISIIQKDLDVLSLDNDACELLLCAYLAGKEVGAANAIIEYANNDFLANSVKSFLSSMDREKGHSSANEAKEKCFGVATKYWENGGLMNHAELASIMMAEIAAYDVGNETKYLSGTMLRKTISQLANSYGKQYGMPNVKKRTFEIPRNVEYDYDDKNIEKYILNLMLDDFEKCTGITKGDAGFSKNEYTPITKKEAMIKMYGDKYK